MLVLWRMHLVAGSASTLEDMMIDFIVINSGMFIIRSSSSYSIGVNHE